MKIHILSDVHFDVVATKSIRDIGADLLICAGDVCQGAEKSHTWLHMMFPTTELVNVPGNHTFYMKEYVTEIQHPNLDHNSVRFFDNGRVRVIASTLWTDYELYGADSRDLAMHAASRSMNDHRLIKYSKKPFAKFSPYHAYRLHKQARAFVAAKLAEPHDGPTIVVSHHAPHPNSIAAKYGTNILNAAYASDLSDLIIRHQPDLWVHGHVHGSFDYAIPGSKTRVLCNPHGYGDENPEFDPALMIEI